VRETLRQLLVDTTIAITTASGTTVRITVEDVEEVARIPLPLALNDAKAILAVRGHVRALFAATLVARDSGRRFPHLVYVKGTGHGYYGEHSRVVAEALSRYVPTVYGCRNGLLYREWIPSERALSVAFSNLDGDEKMAAADRIARYVVARRDSLSVASDPAERIPERQPIWQRASVLMGNAFGRLAILVRPGLRTFVASVLKPGAGPASIVDGSMGSSNWFLPPAHPDGNPSMDLLKVDFDELAFTNYDRYCYDASFDVALTAASAEALSDEEFGRRVRSRYEMLTGETISETRRFLYQLASLNADREQVEWMATQSNRGSSSMPALAQHDGPSSAQAVTLACHEAAEALERVIGVVHMTYMADVYLKPPATPAVESCFCAIDIDGVLETRHLGFSATTPAGILSLRALARHGYGAVLATGRSAAELRERCRVYRLPGGVAEYGAVIYNGTKDETEVLLTIEDRDILGTLRRALAAQAGVYLDNSYRYAVRAFRIDNSANRRGLSVDEATAILRSLPSGDRLKPIFGQRQTDFMVKSVDKGTGLQALMKRLVADDSNPTLAFAVGDTEYDLPMFRLAEAAFAPRNADAAVRAHAAAPGRSRRFQLVSRPFQAGLFQSVARVLGHEPGQCHVCAAAKVSTEARLLLSVLAAQDRGKFGKLASAASLYLRAGSSQ
jgi:hydroxymethylpyrimidine pyrophosphatase-like HAD family hydrolase